MPPRLDMSNVRKSFGATRALDDVNLTVLDGEAHALIGENGAGKSTLMRILAGAIRADAGRILLDGTPFRPGNPRRARQRGIAMIHQELSLAPDLDVTSNVLLGIEPSRLGWIRAAEARAVARNTLDKLGHGDLPLDAPAATLGAASRQVVEIARALVGMPRVLIMDEPTSSLGPQDVETLFSVIERLKALDVSVIYISHFLEECEAVCDRYTVLRDGATAATGEMSSEAVPRIVEQMVGAKVETIYPRRAGSFGEVLLAVNGVGPGHVDLSVRRGEILGIAGLVGAGRTRTLRRSFGLDGLTGGAVTIRGETRRALSPAVSVRRGVGFLSEDRKTDGLLQNLSVADNLTMSRLEPLTRAGYLSARRQRAAAAPLVTALHVKAVDLRQPVSSLSGGNQQKIALGRLLHQDAGVLLLDEPTRGIDIASKLEIYRVMRELADRGKAIVFVSSYLPELVGVCDTIAVMCRQRLVATRPAVDWTEHELMQACIGGSA